MMARMSFMVNPWPIPERVSNFLDSFFNDQYFLLLQVFLQVLLKFAKESSCRARVRGEYTVNNYFIAISNAPEFPITLVGLRKESKSAKLLKQSFSQVDKLYFLNRRSAL
jgi:hypothetical protein